jgi:hypothetical protein
MPINFITCNITYFPFDGFNYSPDQLRNLTESIEDNIPNYSELKADMALRNTCADHLIPIFNKFFAERFECLYLKHIYADTYFIEPNQTKKARYIFAETNQQNFIELNLENEIIYLGDIHFFYKETSALANALGLILKERDNYPGGKQKIAFNLIDVSWSALQSKLPLVIY